MTWTVILAHLVAGMLLANSVPHFVNGISGNPFQSPFASPPGVGESSPLVNVLWGAANFAVGYLLLFGTGDFHWGISVDAAIVGLGGLLLAVGLAIHFGQVRSRRSRSY